MHMSISRRMEKQTVVSVSMKYYLAIKRKELTHPAWMKSGKRRPTQEHRL